MMHAAELWTRMTDSWGYFTGEGYGGHLFPVIIGESGTMYHTVSPFSPNREHCILCNYVLPTCTAFVSQGGECAQTYSLPKS